MQSHDILSSLNEFGIVYNENEDKWSLYSNNDLFSFLKSSGIKQGFPIGVSKLNLDDFFSGRSSIELEYPNLKPSNLINEIDEFKYKDTQINSRNYFEQIVSFEGGLQHFKNTFRGKIQLTDELITYELSRPSIHFIMLSFFQLTNGYVKTINDLPTLIKNAFFDENEYIGAIKEEERIKNSPKFGYSDHIKRAIQLNFQTNVSKLLIEMQLVESELEWYSNRDKAYKFYRDLGKLNTELLSYGQKNGFDEDVIKKFDQYKQYYRRIDHNNINKGIELNERRMKMAKSRLKSLRNFENFLSEGIFRNIWTLKISSAKDLETKLFQDLSNTFLFHLNHKDLPVFKIYPRVFEPLKSNFLSDFNNRRYKKELVYYYHRGLKTEDPTLSFLSFYHVMEFFCKKFADKYSIGDVRNLLKDPKFSVNDEKKIIKLINTIQRSQKRLNDKIKLKLVIEAYVDKKDLLNLFDNPSINNLNHFKKLNKNNKSIMTKFDILINDYPLINNNGNFLKDNLVERIYAIRNALVHSKSGEDYAFVPFSGDEEALKKEIPIMKFLAEQIIIKTSKRYEF